jgi:hypothetical protein
LQEACHSLGITNTENAKRGELRQLLLKHPALPFSSDPSLAVAVNPFAIANLKKKDKKKAIVKESIAAELDLLKKDVPVLVPKYVRMSNSYSLLLFDKLPYTGTGDHHRQNVKAYHDSMANLSVADLDQLLVDVGSFLSENRRGKDVTVLMRNLVKARMGCDVPFDIDRMMMELAEGEIVDAHVDFGLCPWHTCAGKTNSGMKSGVDTSLLGKFHHRLDHAIQTSMISISNFNRSCNSSLSAAQAFSHDLFGFAMVLSAKLSWS